jgi:hypothetical protein
VSCNFILSFRDHNLGSEIFSCHTFSLFDVIFLVSVFLVSESFLVEPRIMEIRHRRQQHLQNVAERARRHNRAEMTRRKKALEMRRGECLLVKDQISPFFTCL